MKKKDDYSTTEIIVALEGAINRSEEILAQLSMRWEDEKDYENIDDYSELVRKVVGKRFIAMTKDPFGFTLSLPHDLTGHVTAGEAKHKPGITVTGKVLTEG